MKSKPRLRTLDDSTVASDPGGVRLSHDRLRILRPELYGFRNILHRLRTLFAPHFPLFEMTMLKEQLQHGDSRAAVVVSVDPLLVAAYTDELDCIAMLRFPQRFVADYGLREGTCLLTVNSYRRDPMYQADLIVDPHCVSHWTGFNPLIADFLSEDFTRIAARKRQIEQSEWQRAYAMGVAYLQRRPGIWRDGKPIYSFLPCASRQDA